MSYNKMVYEKQKNGTKMVYEKKMKKLKKGAVTLGRKYIYGAV